MKIAVLIKQVPDTWVGRRLDADSLRLIRDADDAVVDEIAERALEVALQVKDEDRSTEVTVLTMGPDSAHEALLKCLAMGADCAIHIRDDALTGADLVRTARVLASALASDSYDLVLAGIESSDGGGAVVPAMVAEILGIPLLSAIESVSIGQEVSGTRSADGVTMSVRAPFPAIVSVTERVAEPRFPNLKGTLFAKRKPQQVLGLGDLSVQAEGGAQSVVTAISARPSRVAGVKIVDDGTAASRLADFLADARLI